MDRKRIHRIISQGGRLGAALPRGKELQDIFFRSQLFRKVENMRKILFFKIAVVALACWAGGVYLSPASAATLTYGLDYEFSGATPPAGTAPWITATFDDSFGGANTVRLTMSASNLVGSEFVDDWLFNFNPTLDPTLLSFNWISGQTANSVSTGVDAFKADGDGDFDIEFDFPPPPGTFADKFTAGETSIYDLTFTSAISVSDFNFASVNGGGVGVFNSAAHVQSIGPNESGSGWIGPGSTPPPPPPPPIPEPSAMLLFGTGLLGLGFAGWKKKKS